MEEPDKEKDSILNNILNHEFVRLSIFGKAKKKSAADKQAIDQAYTTAEAAFNDWLTKQVNIEAETESDIKRIKEKDPLAPVYLTSEKLKTPYLRGLLNQINNLATKENIDYELKEALKDVLTTLTEAVKDPKNSKNYWALSDAITNLQQKDGWNDRTAGICTALGGVAMVLAYAAIVATTVVGFGASTTVLPLAGLACSLALIGWIAWEISKNENKDQIETISTDTWKTLRALPALIR